ncbi:MAG: aspartate carbamoyltransferase regulatory subunit [Euryarchaeota archaeon]|nr:aspartate carbamoyltransferase regulatory subunit [Euryarchaeota archaeon]
MNEQTLKVQKIKNGIVIDHIPCGMALKVLKILGIEGDRGSTVTMAMHVNGKNGPKDIVKIEDRNLDEREIDKIALIAPSATVNIVENYEVVKKHRVHVPMQIKGIVKCMNPKCITNQREPVESEFTVLSEEPLILKCRYCGREMKQKDVIESII